MAIMRRLLVIVGFVTLGLVGGLVLTGRMRTAEEGSAATGPAAAAAQPPAARAAAPVAAASWAR